MRANFPHFPLKDTVAIDIDGDTDITLVDTELIISLSPWIKPPQLCMDTLEGLETLTFSTQDRAQTLMEYLILASLK